MTCDPMDQLIRLHKRAERHSNEYRKLLRDSGAGPEALRHLQKAERLYSQVSSLIRNLTSAQADPDGDFPGAG